MRAALALILASLLAACSNVGAECGSACDRVQACEDLDKVFLLDCSPFGSGCFDATLACADCINTHSCEEMQNGACDGTCSPAPSDGGS